MVRIEGEYDNAIHLKEFPGTQQHQLLLKAIVEQYENDLRILAVGVFGSLGRGNWDEFSDLDLDVIVDDNARLDVGQELLRLAEAFSAIGEPVALIIPDGEDAGDMVLQSLAQVSIRYHTLATTSPNILDTLLIVFGRIDPAPIAAAGRANHPMQGEPLHRLLDRCLRFALGVEIAIQRGQIWMGVEQLHRMRALIMEIYTRTHQGQRNLQTFQAQADRSLQNRLGASLPGYDIASVREALQRFLIFLVADLEQLTGGDCVLNDAHLGMIERIRSRTEL